MNNGETTSQLDLSQATGELINPDTLALTGPKAIIDKLYAIIETVKSSSTKSAYESLGDYSPLVSSLKRASDTTLIFTGSLGSFEDLFQKNNIKITHTTPAPTKK